MQNLAPIILFAYNRPEHLTRTLAALSDNELASDSILIIYCDGAKKDASKEEQKAIAQVRKIAYAQMWCKELKVVEQTENKGLAESIINGVAEITSKYGKAIVLEDDILTSKFFLRFMNDALNVYEKEDTVLSIGACNFFAHGDNIPETFFVPIPDCWGWATWKNRWELFERDGQKLLNLLKEKQLLKAFNLGGRYDFEQMLKDQIEGKNNSWAIRWQALAYIQNKLALYPKKPQSHNIGFGKNSTNTKNSNEVFNTYHLLHQKVEVRAQKIETNENVMKGMYSSHTKSFGAPSFFNRIRTFISFKK